MKFDRQGSKCTLSSKYGWLFIQFGGEDIFTFMIQLGRLCFTCENQENYRQQKKVNKSEVWK